MCSYTLGLKEFFEYFRLDGREVEGNNLFAELYQAFLAAAPRSEDRVVPFGGAEDINGEFQKEMWMWRRSSISRTGCDTYECTPFWWDYMYYAYPAAYRAVFKRYHTLLPHLVDHEGSSLISPSSERDRSPVNLNMASTSKERMEEQVPSSRNKYAPNTYPSIWRNAEHSLVIARGRPRQPTNAVQKKRKIRTVLSDSEEESSSDGENEEYNSEDEIDESSHGKEGEEFTWPADDNPEDRVLVNGLLAAIKNWNSQMARRYRKLSHGAKKRPNLILLIRREMGPRFRIMRELLDHIRRGNPITSRIRQTVEIVLSFQDAEKTGRYHKDFMRVLQYDVDPMHVETLSEWGRLIGMQEDSDAPVPAPRNFYKSRKAQLVFNGKQKLIN